MVLFNLLNASLVLYHCLFERLLNERQCQLVMNNTLAVLHGTFHNVSYIRKCLTEK